MDDQAGRGRDGARPAKRRRGKGGRTKHGADGRDAGRDDAGRDADRRPTGRRAAERRDDPRAGSNPLRPAGGTEPVAPAPSRPIPDGATDPADLLELDRPTVLALLREGELDVQGRLVEASNLNLYCSIVRRCPDPEADLVGAAVYKPIAGERPLDDFPDGTLAMREVAAYVVSEATGWGIVPPTILRDGPFGPGMVQLWIDVDESIEVIDLLRGEDPALRRMAVFDAVVNNADRKGGHLLPVEGGHIFGVDHGICFSPDPKLRTILWAWRGEPFNDEELAVLRHLQGELGGSLGDELRQLLAPGEVTATTRRVNRLLAGGMFPQPDPYRPAIPWPPF